MKTNETGFALINRNVFFEYVRKAPFGGRLTTGQVDGLTRILNEWEERGLSDVRYLAYMYATTFLETAFTMQPVREYGGEKYLKSKRYYPWVGEGLVQVTWEDNHRKFGATKPGQLLTWPIALKALFDGMLYGMFTGKKLSDYFNDTKEDPVNARRIINGTDKAKLVAGYYKNFLDAIKASLDEKKITEVPETVETEDVKPIESKGFWSSILGSVASVGGIFSFSSIDNVFALAAFSFILAIASILIYSVLTGKIVIKR